MSGVGETPDAPGVDEPVRPEGVVRARAGHGVRRLLVAGVLVIVGAAVLLADGLLEGIPRIIVSLLLLASFGFGVLSVAAITLRWRTSVRSDGRALVVRDPLGARVIPFTEHIVIGRWLDADLKPVHGVLDHGRRVASISPDLDPVSIEAFAHRVGLPVVDLDLDGAPGPASL